MKVLNREPSNTMLRTEMLTVQPDDIEGRFLLSVTRPEQAPDSGKLQGTIATDGNMSVGTLFQTATFLEMEPAIPPQLLVTIGYPLDHAVPMMVARNRELTPTAWPDFDRTYGAVLNKECPHSGQADAFLAFITDELQPFLEGEFGVDPAEWTLAGHSLGGLFTTHALLNAPERFRRYLAVGSSYWWQHGEIFERAEAFASESGKIDVKVFLSAGDGESRAALTKAWEPMLEDANWREYLDVLGGIPELVGDTQRMAEVLGRRPGCRTKAQVFENESHGSAAIVAFSQGLRWLHAA